MKGVFIPGITCEMLKNADIDAVEQLIAEGTWLDVENDDFVWRPADDPPKTEEYVLCTVERKDGTRSVIRGYHAPEPPGRWVVTGINSNVIAWRPMPAPFGGKK